MHHILWNECPPKIGCKIHTVLPPATAEILVARYILSCYLQQLKYFSFSGKLTILMSPKNKNIGLLPCEDLLINIEGTIM